jgi:hypothetical protein
MAFKTTYSQYDNKIGLFSTESPLDLTTIPSNENKITASDGEAGDRFGNSVAIGNGRIVVGAYNDGLQQGSAYIFDLDGTQLAKITASDGADYDYFGTSVAIGNGRIVVGAYLNDDNGSASGSAYIFDLDGTELAKITASDGTVEDWFGYSVAIGNGRIVVGAHRDNSFQGSAYIFDLDGTELSKITASDGAAEDFFGESVAVGNGRIVVGAARDTDGKGAAYIFDLDGTQLAKITASDGVANDRFGQSVAIGNGRIVVGAWGDDDNGSTSGSAYIFDLDGTQLAKITASDGTAFDSFGRSVSVGNGRIVVGAEWDNPAGSFSGSSYIFDLDGTQLAKITASDGAANASFGYSVAVGSGHIVVGAYYKQVGANDQQGSAYIYETPNIKDYFDILE